MRESLVQTLLISDDETYAEIVRQDLVQDDNSGFELTWVRRFREAMTALKVLKSDAILLDLSLPGSINLKDFNEINRLYSDTPILTVANDSKFDGLAGAAMRSGSQDHLSKKSDSPPNIPQAIRYAIERKSALRHISESEIRYRRLFETAKDGILIIDAESGKITDANPFIEKLLGYPVGDFIGKHLWEISPFKDKIANELEFKLLQEQGYVRYEHLPLAAKSGATVPVEFVCNVYSIGNRQVIQCNIRDISERARADAAEKSLKIFLQSTLDALDSHIAVIDEKGTIVAVNKAWSDFCSRNGGVEAKCGVGANYVDVCITAMESKISDATQFLRSLNEIFVDSNNAFWYEYPCPSPTEDRWFRVSVNRFEGDGPMRVAISHVDITQQKIGEIEITRSNREIRILNSELEKRVEQRTADLFAATFEANRANHFKSEFLSRMSHELRTPLNSILGFGQILEQQDLGPICLESVGSILKSGRHLLDLINDILDISKVESGSEGISVETIPVQEILSESCALMRPLAQRQKIVLVEVKLDHWPLCVSADARRLKQVLLNLLANAIKYNQEGGEVRLSAKTAPNQRVLIEIEDTGNGISSEGIAKLFSPFERLGFAQSTVEGTGLGLALSKRLIESMDGRIHVSSVLGSGSIFTLDLPEAKVKSSIEKVKASRSPALYLRAKGNYSVLCIEDNVSNFHLIEAIFRSNPNISLLSAMQGRVGLDLASGQQIDLILLDLHLPDIMGADVLAELKAVERTRNIPVIVMSADATPSQMKRLLAAGADRYLTKPIDVIEFLTTVDEMLAKSISYE